MSIRFCLNLSLSEAQRDALRDALRLDQDASHYMLAAAIKFHHSGVSDVSIRGQGRKIVIMFESLSDCVSAAMRLGHITGGLS